MSDYKGIVFRAGHRLPKGKEAENLQRIISAFLQETDFAVEEMKYDDGSSSGWFLLTFTSLAHPDRIKDFALRLEDRQGPCGIEALMLLNADGQPVPLHAPAFNFRTGAIIGPKPKP